MLIDLAELPPQQVEPALEALQKALRDDDGLAHDIWAPHENPFIRQIVELLSERGLLRLKGLREELQQFVDGDVYAPNSPLVPAPVGSISSPQALTQAFQYLRGKPVEVYTFDDWALCVDYLMYRHMPEAPMEHETTWALQRASVMGRVQGSLTVATQEQAAKLLAAMPEDPAGAWKWERAELAVLDYARQNAASLVQSISDGARLKLRGLVFDHCKKLLSGEVQDSQSLTLRLLDAFGTLNRDWRMIAVTEVGETCNQGVIATLKPGTRVKRLEMYHGACAWCKKIDGVVLTVVPADKKYKDGEKEVWPGKTNFGRSIAKYKRTPEGLVERLPSELYWIAAGVQHPHCRGRWEPLSKSVEGADPAFESWLRKTLGL